jgi:hypothetical protein
MSAQDNSRDRTKRTSQLIQGLFFGLVFGFLLQKGGVTKYDVIVGQLLLKDFTVLKIMLTAVLVGMTGIYTMKWLGWVELYPKSGSLGMNVIGGLIFGAGFAILGYCPGTIAGAVGNGYLDALLGGVAGIMLGAGLFAALYPWLNEGVLKWGFYGNVTLPQIFKVRERKVVIIVAVAIIVILAVLEVARL